MSPPPARSQRRNERLVSLDVGSLTLHPRARLLPIRSEDSVAFRALKQSIHEHGLLQRLVVDEKDRLIHGRDRFRAVQALGWPRVSCLRVNSDETDAILAEANLNGSQYNKSQRALLIAAQYGEVFAGREQRRKANLCRGRAPMRNNFRSEPAPTLAHVAHRFAISTHYLWQAGSLWEAREGRSKPWIQRVMDGKMNLAKAYAGFIGKRNQQPSAYELLRRCLNQARHLMARFEEIENEGEHLKIREAMLRLLDETDRMLAAKRKAARATVWPGLHAGGLKG
ncbi:MAG: ParB N-terminal domain-containing protein [Verrucomicrobia bacterium]|nr:ParB N-terminal domain-containing protein [Verrucomicrobiota bacterium]